MPAHGEFQKQILNVGKAPGEADDIAGYPWQGKAGRLLRRAYRECGIDLYQDCLNINAINCRPLDNEGDDREPSAQEITCCRSRILQVIKAQKPKVIVLFGTCAINTFLGHRIKKDLGGIHKWRGSMIPDREFKAWVLPIFSPQYLESEKEIAIETIWKQDLQRIIEALNTPFPVSEREEQYIELLDTPDDMFKMVSGVVSIDYETTGLKPHATGHQIACASVAFSEKKCQVFPMPQTKSGQRAFTQMLANPSVKKMAHNMKFEEAWSISKLRQPIESWYWDSLMAAHILDNRPGIGGLKFQVYIYFGVLGYDDEIAPYLKADDNKNANAFNRVLEIMNVPVLREKLMIYCGLDSIFQYKLAKIQMETIYAHSSENARSLPIIP
jgi:uracil-DNA glycosylase family 4